MINLAKCIGCRQGIDAFIESLEEPGRFHHLDLLKNQYYICNNYEQIAPYLKLDGNIYYLTGTLDIKFRLQSLWWQDIMNLSFKIFKDYSTITKFFTDRQLFTKPNMEIETTLLELDHRIKITKKDFPDLLKFS